MLRAHSRNRSRGALRSDALAFDLACLPRHRRAAELCNSKHGRDTFSRSGSSDPARLDEETIRRHFQGGILHGHSPMVPASQGRGRAETGRLILCVMRKDSLMLRAGAFAALAALALFAVGCETCGNHCGHGGCGNGGCISGGCASGNCGGGSYIGSAENLEPVPPPNGGGGY
jgi:hypothetical protein